jgi:hypothetical protein
VGYNCWFQLAETKSKPAPVLELGTFKNRIQYWVLGSIYGLNWNQNIWEKKVFEKRTGTEVKQRLIKGLITGSRMGCLEEMGFDFQNLNQNQNWIFLKKNQTWFPGSIYVWNLY